MANSMTPAPGHRPEHNPEHTCERRLKAVGEHPLPATMLAFGVGFGVGVALANVIVESASRKSADSSQVEALGHSVLNALMTAVPDSISKRLHR